MSPFNSHLLLYCSVPEGKSASVLPWSFFAMLMNSYVEMVNDVLVAGAVEICIITITGEDFPW